MSETGVNFLKQALLEHSVCPVPAHPDALVAARSKGIDVAPIKSWAERTLDLLHTGAQRQDVERLRAATNETTLISLAGLDLPSSRSSTAPIDCAPLSKGLALLRTFQQKAGRVLSAANEDAIRAAVASLQGVLDQLDVEDDKQITIDGELIEDEIDISEAEIQAIIRRVLEDEVMRLTGRLG